jgi:hypothetical protein
VDGLLVFLGTSGFAFAGLVGAFTVVTATGPMSLRRWAVLAICLLAMAIGFEGTSALLFGRSDWVKAFPVEFGVWCVGWFAVLLLLTFELLQPAGRSIRHRLIGARRSIGMHRQLIDRVSAPGQAQTLIAHAIVGVGRDWVRCSCGWTGSAQDHTRHAAGEAIPSTNVPVDPPAEVDKAAVRELANQAAARLKADAKLNPESADARARADALLTWMHRDWEPNVEAELAPDPDALEQFKREPILTGRHWATRDYMRLKLKHDVLTRYLGDQITLGAVIAPAAVERDRKDVDREINHYISMAKQLDERVARSDNALTTEEEWKKIEADLHTLLTTVLTLFHSQRPKYWNRLNERLHEPIVARPFPYWQRGGEISEVPQSPDEGWVYQLGNRGKPLRERLGRVVVTLRESLEDDANK